MRIGSLFSGAGGLDMAVQSVFGGEVVWHSEIDKAASKVLAHHFPDVVNLGDITKVNWGGWKPLLEVDVLCGGFPCQDVSAAGKRAGIKAGTRSGLWAIFAEAIGMLKPRFVVMENVRGLLSAPAHRMEPGEIRGLTSAEAHHMESQEAAMGDGSSGPVLRAAGAVLGDLADLGYDAVWATVAAASVGAPHRRERVFIVAWAADAKGDGWDGRPGDQLSVGAGDLRRVGGQGTTVVGDGGGLHAADSSRYGWDEGRPESARLVRGSDAAVSGDEPGRVELGPSQFQRNTLPLNAEVMLLPTPNASDGSGGGQHPDKREGHSRQLIDYVLALGEESNAAPEGGPGEGLRDMRDTADPKEVCERTSGGSQRVPKADPLLPSVCEQPTGSAAEHSRVACAACNPGGELRGMRDNGKAACSPQGSQPGQQRSCESCGAVRELPSEIALAGGPGLSGAAHSGVGWGKYEPAIRRWERVLGRPAPAPTEPNKNGNPRLAAEFSSWLMGWPEGWVTDPAIGISRNDQLRIVGNGVCPQQAASALRYLLAVTA
jgi:DNA (cytosine-5)-methyltransferase 1